MGQAYITRRGSSQGRFMIGKTRAESHEPMGTLEISDLPFTPKKLILFLSANRDYSYLTKSNYQFISMTWTQSRGVISAASLYGTDDELSSNEAPSVLFRDGKFYVTGQSRSVLLGETYQWIAFERED